MISPKYKFYVGKNLDTTFTKGKTISIDTGQEVDSSNYYLSNSIIVDSNSTYIYLACDKYGSISTGTNRIYIHFYDSDNAYLGYGYTIGDSLIDIKVNTAYIRVSLSGTGAVNAMIKVQNNKTFIYQAIQFIPDYKKLTKRLKKENGQLFFRAELSGDVKLVGTPFDYVYKANIESKFILVISKLTDSLYNTYYKGTFAKTDCKFDFMKNICTPKLTTLDAYNDILAKYENTYDLIKLAPDITSITLYKRALTQCYIRGGNTISNYFSGTYYETDVNEVIDDNNLLKNTYYFAYIQASNEFTIEDASIAEVNGLYAGRNGSYINQATGCECFLEKYPENMPPLKPYLIGIRRKSDGTVLYKSTEYINILDETLDPEDVNENTDKHIQYGVPLINTSNPDDSCNIQNLFIYYLYRRLLCNADRVNDTSTYDIPANDFAITTTNYSKCIGLTGGDFFCSSLTVEEPTKYGQNDYGNYFTDNFLPATLGIEKIWPVCRSSWVNTSLWYAYEPSYMNWERPLRKAYTLKDSYSIAATIKALLKEVDPSLKHEATEEYSRFLYGSSSPIGLFRFYVFITQKTNILKGEYDQAAQKAEITFKDVMDMLQKCFKCYWYIEDSKLKIEHISFFNNGGSYSPQTTVQLDFTKLTDQFNKKLVAYYQSEIEYNKDDLASRYEFNWADDVTDLFGQLAIDVKSNYIQQDKTEDISINNFVSDIDFMLFNPDQFSNDGFALLCPIKSESGYSLPIVEVVVKAENNNTYSVYVQNFYASWLYLAKCYMYDMPASTIENSSIPNLTVQDIKRCMEHTIEFPFAEDPDEVALIKTSLGNGTIDELSINLDTRKVEATLIYRPS